MDVFALHVKLCRVFELLTNALEATEVLNLNNELQCQYWEGIRAKLHGLSYQDEASYWKEVEVLTTHHISKIDMKHLRNQIENIVTKGTALEKVPKAPDSNHPKKTRVKVQPTVDQSTFHPALADVLNKAFGNSVRAAARLEGYDLSVTRSQAKLNTEVRRVLALLHQTGWKDGCEMMGSPHLDWTDFVYTDDGTSYASTTNGHGSPALADRRVRPSMMASGASHNGHSGSTMAQQLPGGVLLGPGGSPLHKGRKYVNALTGSTPVSKGGCGNPLPQTSVGQNARAKRRSAVEGTLTCGSLSLATLKHKGEASSREKEREPSDYQGVVRVDGVSPGTGGSSATGPSAFSPTSASSIPGNATKYRAQLKVFGRTVILGEYDTPRSAAEARDRAYIRTVGPRTAYTAPASEKGMEGGLNYHICKYACDPIHVFTSHDAKLKSDLWGTRWTGVKPLDFAFLAKESPKATGMEVSGMVGVQGPQAKKRRGMESSSNSGSSSGADKPHMKGGGERRPVGSALSGDSVTTQLEALKKLDFLNTGSASIIGAPMPLVDGRNLVHAADDEVTPVAAEIPSAHMSGKHDRSVQHTTQRKDIASSRLPTPPCEATRSPSPNFVSYDLNTVAYDLASFYTRRSLMELVRASALAKEAALKSRSNEPASFSTVQSNRSPGRGPSRARSTLGMHRFRLYDRSDRARCRDLPPHICRILGYEIVLAQRNMEGVGVFERGLPVAKKAAEIDWILHVGVTADYDSKLDNSSSGSSHSTHAFKMPVLTSTQVSWDACVGKKKAHKTALLGLREQIRNSIKKLTKRSSTTEKRAFNGVLQLSDITPVYMLELPENVIDPLSRLSGNNVVCQGYFSSAIEAALIREQILDYTGATRVQGPCKNNFSTLEWSTLVGLGKQISMFLQLSSGKRGKA